MKVTLAMLRREARRVFGEGATIIDTPDAIFAADGPGVDTHQRCIQAHAPTDAERMRTLMTCLRALPSAKPARPSRGK